MCRFDGWVGFGFGYVDGKVVGFRVTVGIYCRIDEWVWLGVGYVVGEVIGLRVTVGRNGVCVVDEFGFEMECWSAGWLRVAVGRNGFCVVDGFGFEV